MPLPWARTWFLDSMNQLVRFQPPAEPPDGGLVTIRKTAQIPDMNTSAFTGGWRMA
jgi:hypothetical protein